MDTNRNEIPELQLLINSHEGNSPLALPPGEFFGQITIDRPIIIEGKGRKTWIGSIVSPTIRIISQGVVIRDVMVEATRDPQDTAIEAADGTSPRIENVILRGTTVGIPKQNHPRSEGQRITFVPPPPRGTRQGSLRKDLIVAPTDPSSVPVSTTTSPLANIVSLRFEEAAEAEKKRDWQTAIDIYGDILNLSPDHPDAQKLLESTCRRSGTPMPDHTKVGSSSVPPPCSVRETKPEIDRSSLLGHQWTEVISSVDAVKQLLADERVHIDAKDDSGETALMAAARLGYKSVVKLLLDRGADINAKDDRGETALDKCSWQSDSMQKLLIDNGAKGWRRDSAVSLQEERDRLHERLIVAASAGDLNEVKRLLDEGADPTDLYTGRNVALWCAAAAGHEPVVQFLLNAGADLTRNSDVLECAAAAGHEQVVKLLLDRGLDVNAKENRSNLEEEENPDFAALLALLEVEVEDDIGGINGLGEAAEAGHESVVKLLLDRGADAKAKDRTGDTALMRAARGGHTDIVQLLLDRGAGVDINAHNNKEQTALHSAAKEDNLSVVRLLLDRGADVNSRDKDGDTPLICATMNGGKAYLKDWPDYGASSAQLLVDRGADINSRDRDSITALFWAARNGMKSTAKLLLDRGADKGLTDSWGRTAMDWAIVGGQQEVIDFLRSYDSKK